MGSVVQLYTVFIVCLTFVIVYSTRNTISHWLDNKKGQVDNENGLELDNWAIFRPKIQFSTGLPLKIFGILQWIIRIP